MKEGRNALNMERERGKENPKERKLEKIPNKREKR